MKFFNIFIALCTLCVLCAAIPVSDNSLNRLSNSSVGQKLLSSAKYTILKRSRRSIIKAGCPKYQFRFGSGCMTCLEYTIKFEEDCPLDNEIN